MLPALALGVNSAAIISRLVRTSMLEVLREDFVRTAYAKGLRRPRVMIRHALRNALLPVISVIGLRFGALLGGAVLTESIFGWPGLGQLTIAAISQRDLPLIQGVVLTFALMFALVNLDRRSLLCGDRSAREARVMPCACRAPSATPRSSSGGLITLAIVLARRLCAPVSPPMASSRWTCANASPDRRRRIGSAPTISAATCGRE